MTKKKIRFLADSELYDKISKTLEANQTMPKRIEQLLLKGMKAEGKI